MIYALEGPDRSGKSTLYEALRGLPNVVYGPQMPRIPTDVVHYAELWQAALWDALYDPRRTYLVDRFFAVTDAVYGRLYGRPVADYSMWYHRVHVLYVQVPLTELRCRYAETGDALFDQAHYERLVECYSEVLPSFSRVTYLDGTQSTSTLSTIVKGLICG